MIINLSPYEKGRIIPTSFGDTEMGRDLLAQDYILKQMTASLMYPENQLGEAFWNRVKDRVQQEYGTTDLPLNTFNKIWIVPQSAKVYEHGNSAYVAQSTLDVMLEEDLVALENTLGTDMQSDVLVTDDTQIISGLSSEIIREVIIPEIKHEVNHGRMFAKLRKIYNCMILASWYKTSLKESLLGQVYVDQNKTLGIDTLDKTANQQIYDQYVSIFKEGLYEYVKEEYDPVHQQIIPRKYFSGGFGTGSPAMISSVVHIVKAKAEQIGLLLTFGKLQIKDVRKRLFTVAVNLLDMGKNSNPIAAIWASVNTARQSGTKTTIPPDQKTRNTRLSQTLAGVTSLAALSAFGGEFQVTTNDAGEQVISVIIKSGDQLNRIARSIYEINPEAFQAIAGFEETITTLQPHHLAQFVKKLNVSTPDLIHAGDTIYIPFPAENANTFKASLDQKEIPYQDLTATNPVPEAVDHLNNQTPDSADLRNAFDTTTTEINNRIAKIQTQIDSILNDPQVTLDDLELLYKTIEFQTHGKKELSEFRLRTLPEILEKKLTLYDKPPVTFTNTDPNQTPIDAHPTATPPAVDNSASLDPTPQPNMVTPTKETEPSITNSLSSWWTSTVENTSSWMQTLASAESAGDFAYNLVLPLNSVLTDLGTNLMNLIPGATANDFTASLIGASIALAGLGGAFVFNRYFWNKQQNKPDLKPKHQPDSPQAISPQAISPQAISPQAIRISNFISPVPAIRPDSDSFSPISFLESNRYNEGDLFEAINRVKTEFKTIKREVLRILDKSDADFESNTDFPSLKAISDAFNQVNQMNRGMTIAIETIGKFYNLEKLINRLNHYLVGNKKSKRIATKALGIINHKIESLSAFITSPDTLTADAAMTPVGGIFLDRELMDLQIERDGNGVPVPMDAAMMHDLKIEGFVPIITTITPVTSIPMLLGMEDSEDFLEKAGLLDNTVPADQADSGAASKPYASLDKWRWDFTPKTDTARAGKRLPHSAQV